MLERRKLIRRQADRELLARVAQVMQGGAGDASREETWAREQRHKRRHAIRHNCSVHLRLEVTHRAGGDDGWSVDLFPLKGRLLDLSAEGASVFTAGTLQIGQPLSLIIGLQDGRQINARGHVRWTKGVEKRDGYASGLQFSQISDQARKIIVHFLRELDETIGL